MKEEGTRGMKGRNAHYARAFTSSATWLLRTASSFIKSRIAEFLRPPSPGDRLKTRYIGRKTLCTARPSASYRRRLSREMMIRACGILMTTSDESPRTLVNFNLMDFSDSRLFFFFFSCHVVIARCTILHTPSTPFQGPSALVPSLVHIYVIHKDLGDPIQDNSEKNDGFKLIDTKIAKYIMRHE